MDQDMTLKEIGVDVSIDYGFILKRLQK